MSARLLLVWSGLLSLMLFGAVISPRARAGDAKDPDLITFEGHIRPLLEAKCFSCHGDKKQSAGLDLRSKAGMLRGGESGPVLTPGSLEKSLLFDMVHKQKMPPKDGKLSPEQVALIKKWIETGAHAAETITGKTESVDLQVTDADRKFWAFQKPIRPALPQVKQSHRVRTPIDSFIIAALEQNGLTLSPEADRLMLIRRAYFDLIGLPPSPEEVQAFLTDPATDAYELLIERLLGSQHYGERWGRHWLDLAGYADSEGILTFDYVRTAAWRYRDYIIRAFNKDKPYDRFLKEQIAGDELVDYWTAHRTQKQLAPEVVEALEATGYLRCACDTSRRDFLTTFRKDAPGYFYQTLNDTMKIVTSSTMALTVECAKCHSHKFDPIPQTDYYRLQNIFMSAYRPNVKEWVPQLERKLSESTEAQEKEAKAHNDKIDAALAPVRKQLEDLKTQFGEKLFAERLAKLPKVIQEDVKTALATEEAKRNEVQKYLVAKFQKQLRPEGDELIAALKKRYADYKKQSETIEATIATEEAKKRTFPEIRAIYDLPGEPKTPILRRGDYTTPGADMPPGVLSVLAPPKPFTWQPPPKEARTSGRRLAFAEWLTQPDHPLTARVMVNRIWLHHFGEGIVATPDNFGKTGKPPSHPELLDWLTTEFVARGWSIKAMHRLIMTSSAYRQSSKLEPGLHDQAKNIDPENRLVWRQRLRRLEAEALRDGMLRVAGTLNPEMYGPPVPMQAPGKVADDDESGRANGEVTTPDGPAGNRRSVYLQVRRTQPLTLLEVFDQPRMETNATFRMNSTVSSQALTLLNSDFMIRQADAFAERILKEKPDDPIGHAVQLAFVRPANKEERLKLAAFMGQQVAHHSQVAIAAGAASDGSQAQRRALADLCHMLLSANEFLYVD